MSDMGSKELSFAVFADLHYKKGMYAVCVDDLKKIMNRAYENEVDFVIHAGDFSNDYKGSPEIVKEYIENEYNLLVYGIYGNHELESKDNTMEVVTPLLTNDANVVWGTEDGSLGDGSIGYYYFEKNGYRIICTDTNYSYNEALQTWEHNKTASWGAQAGNIAPHSLGAEQLEWLESVLMDAAEQGISCIVVSHAGFIQTWQPAPETGIAHMWNPSPDMDRVRELFQKVNAITARTVILCINGHYHTNHMAMEDDILFFDVNTVINGSWIPKEEQHYTDAHTFVLEKYDANGERTVAEEVPLSKLWQSVNTHYFTEPLSAIVSITVDGSIEIMGSTAEWRYGVEPKNNLDGVMPKISDGWFTL